ncbi:hypothetical protein HELRODRAFT_171066 [Helobdella robusta]|uniref:Uncharacterized protein n=1 Tax=Helobdella robusta TaxID=6412 RepID=T1F3S1_HELRO|nr:hypothetical protein HELRODRAFT_171066 [Helobdella robusta]ESO07025.1 hypothetical protein HELRODRAFT_171066 [Helobdella robusta]
MDVVIAERSKFSDPNSKILHRGMFYDIMFLALHVLGPKEFDLNKFEKDYAAAYKSLPQREIRRTIVADEPCKVKVTWCRKVFSRLQLIFCVFYSQKSFFGPCSISTGLFSRCDFSN